jgi:hypothetical protein
MGYSAPHHYPIASRTREIQICSPSSRTMSRPYEIGYTMADSGFIVECGPLRRPLVFGAASSSHSPAVDVAHSWPERNIRHVNNTLPPCRRCIPLPSQAEMDDKVMLNPILAFEPSRMSTLVELAEPLVEPYEGCFAEAATYPAIPSLALLVPMIPWPLVVHSSSSACVTVGDVLRDLVRMLQSALDPGYRSRAGTTRRIDLLRGKHRVLGFSTSNVGDETFIVHSS